MKKKSILALFIAFITLVGCGNAEDSSSTIVEDTESAQLDEQYAFYDDCVNKLENDMNLNTSQANAVFNTLIEVGLDEEISYCFDKDSFYKVWWGSNNVDVYLADGMVEKIMDRDKQLYPVSTDNTDTLPEIIWKDDENMGIVNLELDGTKLKEAIINDYYLNVSDYLNNLDKTSLKDYEYIQFVGNVVQDDKIECTIKGNLSISAIKSYEDDFNLFIVEENLSDLFIPKPLQ